MIPPRDAGAGAGDPVVTVRDLRVRYPRAAADALDGVGFDLRAGEIAGLVGLDGAGKSTLCRCLDGIVPQLVTADVSGRIRVAGADPMTTPVRRMARLMGIVLDEPSAQLSQGTAGEEVAMGLESLGVPYEEMVARVDDVLREVGLDGARDRPPPGLSGGERQRLVLASVLVMRPAVLVLDQPTAGLDPASRARVFDLLRQLALAGGTCVLVAEHDVELLAERADRLLVLHEGRLVADGAPGDVLGDVPAMTAAGVRVPDVTAVAWALGGGRRAPLPVRLADAIPWLAGESTPVIEPLP